MPNQLAFIVQMYRDRLNVFQPRNQFPCFTWMNFELDEWNTFNVNGISYDIHVLYENEMWEVSIYPLREDGMADETNPCFVNLSGTGVRVASLMDDEILNMVSELEDAVQHIKEIAEQRVQKDSRKEVLDGMRVARNRLQIACDLMGDKA